MNPRVIIIGDVMIDQYLQGEVRRKSPEADIPVLDKVTTRAEAGGAANVALNAKLLDCEVHLVGIVGEDEKASKLLKLVKKHGITTHFISDSSRPTTVKTRVFNGDYQVIRVDEESTEDIDENVQKQLLSEIEKCLSENSFDIAILQDYNKGLFCKKNIKKIISLLQNKNIFIGVDPKNKNIECYQNVDLFKPNFNELRNWAEEENEKFDLKSVKRLGKALKEKIKAKNVLVTLSEHGAMYFSKDEIIHQKSIPIKVADVCGAGDAVMMVSAIAAFQNKSIPDILELCVKTGKIVCLKKGVSTISSGELH